MTAFPPIETTKRRVAKILVNALLAGIAAFSGAMFAAENLDKAVLIAAAYAGARAVFGILSKIADEL